MQRMLENQLNIYWKTPFYVIRLWGNIYYLYSKKELDLFVKSKYFEQKIKEKDRILNNEK